MFYSSGESRCAHYCWLRNVWAYTHMSRSSNVYSSEHSEICVIKWLIAVPRSIKIPWYNCWAALPPLNYDQRRQRWPVTEPRYFDGSASPSHYYYKPTLGHIDAWFVDVEWVHQNNGTCFSYTVTAGWNGDLSCARLTPFAVKNVIHGNVLKNCSFWWTRLDTSSDLVSVPIIVETRKNGWNLVFSAGDRYKTSDRMLLNFPSFYQ